jgi:Rne/Rng family ribonuclease
MKKEILINATVNEVRVGITEDAKLVEFFVEHPDNERIIGNIYYGKVQKIVQGMNAAFIDIGLAQDAFLHFSDVEDSLESSMYSVDDDDDDENESSDEASTPSTDSKHPSSKKRPQKKNNRQKKQNPETISAETTPQSEGETINQQPTAVVDDTIQPEIEPVTGSDAVESTMQTSEVATTSQKKKPSRKKNNKKAPIQNDIEQPQVDIEAQPVEAIATQREVIPPEVKNPAMLLPNRRKITIQGSKIVEDNQFDVAPTENVDVPAESLPENIEQPTETGTVEKQQQKKSQRTAKNKKQVQEEPKVEPAAIEVIVAVEQSEVVPQKKQNNRRNSSKTRANQTSLATETVVEVKEVPTIVTADEPIAPAQTKKPARKATKKKVESTIPIEAFQAETVPLQEVQQEVAKNQRPSRNKKTVVENTVAAPKTTNKANSKKATNTPIESAETTPALVVTAEVKEKTSAKKTTTRRKNAKIMPFTAEVSDEVMLEIPLNDDGSMAEPSNKKGKQKNVQTKPLPTFNTKRSGQVTINLTPKQMIPVQVVRDAYSSKGVRVTTRITIPGRNVVFLPFDNVIGVSKKIHSSKERRRLRRLAQEILPKGSGCIIRTAAQGQTEDDLRRDWEELIVKWVEIEKRISTAEKPTILYNDVNTSTKVIRDLFTENVDAVVIDSYKIFKEIHTYVKWASPQLLDKIIYYTEKRPLFDTYGIEKDIMMLPNRKIYLPSGGSIVIDPTEALVAIDVNTGRATKDKLQEQNALKTNMEALVEIARQLRLRDIGGMVIVDFIDMMYEDNRRKLYQEMVRELNKDRTKTVVYPLTQLGLMQITRQRIRQNIMAVVTEDCTHCRGTGKVYSRSVVLNSLERWLRNYKTTSSAFSIHLLVHPDLGNILTQGEFSLLQKLMIKYFIRIKLHYSTDLPFNEFQFVPIDQE